MKPALLALLIAFSLCSAQKTAIDSVKADIRSLTESQRETEKSVDGIKISVDSLSNKFLSDNFISVKAAKETQELHNEAFKKMQDSFSSFLIAIGIINGVLAVFISALAWVNFRQADNSKKEVKEELSKIKEFEDKIEKLKSEFKEEVKNMKENQNIEFEKKLKEKTEKQEKEFKLAKDNIFTEIADSYIASSLNELRNKNIIGHFSSLYCALYIFNSQEIDLDENSFSTLKDLNYIFNSYKEEYLKDACIFLVSLLNFIRIYNKMNKKEIVKQATEAWNKLCNVFGSEDKVLEALENYKKRDKLW